MDIRELLLKHKNELLDVDLSCLEEELDTGEYDKPYIEGCRELIGGIRDERRRAVERASKLARREEQSDKSAGMLRELSCSGSDNSASGIASDSNAIADIAAISSNSNARELFKSYIENHPELDQSFVEQHIGSLPGEAIDVFLELLTFDEAFLDRYFDVLDRAKIARFQTFSEEFFIRHYDDLSETIVLKQGVNSWKKKADRSRKLNTFLRLKGVQF